MTKLHSTNYKNTLIEVADDCPANVGEEPPLKKDKKTIAYLQYEMVIDDPYKYTSDDVMFSVFAAKKEISDADVAEQRSIFFSKGQPCLRASALPKRYGWGVHSDEKGRIAIFGVESDEYRRLLKDAKVDKTKAMKNKR